jgi:hypothetical protein
MMDDKINRYTEMANKDNEMDHDVYEMKCSLKRSVFSFALKFATVFTLGNSTYMGEGCITNKTASREGNGV